jgi:hypothetical protein
VYSQDLQLLAQHPLLPRSTSQQRSELPEHRPQDDQRQRETLLRERFAELGTEASRFLEGLLASHRSGKAQAQRVLRLLETYRREDFLAALERAARFGAFSLSAVERILAAQAQPKTPLESLLEEQREHLRGLLEDPPVPPRPTGAYEELYPKESPNDEPPREDQAERES